jgi:hypothetical protein
LDEHQPIKARRASEWVSRQEFPFRLRVGLSSSFPFLKKPPQKLFHEPVPLFGDLPAGGRVHAIL